MLRFLWYLLVFPVRLIKFLYFRLHYVFLKERAVYIRIPEHVTLFPRTGLLKVIGTKQETFYFSFLSLLDKVAKEKKFHKVLLEIPSLENLSYYQIEDILHALEKMKENGKILYAYLEEGGIKSLLVAGACHFRYSGQGAQFSIILPSYEQFYLGDFLKKIGIEIEVFRAGKYKSAGEIYTRSQISREAKENLLELLKDLRAEVYTLFKKTYGIQEDRISQLWRNFTEQSIITARELKAVGFLSDFVDAVQFRDFVLQGEPPLIPSTISHHVAGKSDVVSNRENGSPSMFSGKPEKLLDEEGIHRWHYRKTYALFPPLQKQLRVAVVVMEGIIINGDGWDPKPGYIGAKAYRKIFRDLQDSDAAAILVVVNSPGGAGNASETLYQEIRKLSRKKPVYVLQTQVSASGGYYIACGGNRIYSYSTTVTGSVGVLRFRPNLTNLYKKLEIQKSRLGFDKTTEIFSEYEGLSSSSKKLLQKSTEEAYEVFLSRVAVSRNKEIAEVKTCSEGKVYLAPRFRNLEFIDGVSHFYGVLDTLKKDLGWKKETGIVLEFYPALKLSLKDLLPFRKGGAINEFPGDFRMLTETLYLLSPEALKAYLWKF